MCSRVAGAKSHPHADSHGDTYTLTSSAMATSSQGAPEDGQSRFQKIRTHVKEFVEASPEQHKK